MKRTAFKKKSYDDLLKASILKKKEQISKSINKASKSSKKGKNKPKKKVSKPTKGVSKLKKELWKLFSLFIRKRDNFQCVTCGKIGEGGGIHAGHFITGATCGTKLYFDETNVHAQCYHCNINLSGNWVKYEEFMIKKYGKDYTDNLKLRRTLEAGNKVELNWYEEKIKTYKQTSL